MNQGALHLTARAVEYVQLLEALLGRDVETLRSAIADRAVFLAARIAKRDGTPASERLARELAAFMFPAGHPALEFWATDLGRDIAWHIGYPTPTVPIAAAAAVLGVNRTTIWRIRQRFDGPINASRLRELARSRDL